MGLGPEMGASEFARVADAEKPEGVLVLQWAVRRPHVRRGALARWPRVRSGRAGRRWHAGVAREQVGAPELVRWCVRACERLVGV